jgi:hypothetical protein
MEFPVMAGTAIPAASNYILFLGGAQTSIPGSDDHPGFDKTIRLYDTIVQTLTNIGTAPFLIPVTTNTIQKGDLFYITSGEIKPGIRTPDIPNGRIRINN